MVVRDQKDRGKRKGKRERREKRRGTFVTRYLPMLAGVMDVILHLKFERGRGGKKGREGGKGSSGVFGAEYWLSEWKRVGDFRE
jgi:hypothetical protein